MPLTSVTAITATLPPSFSSFFFILPLHTFRFRRPCCHHIVSFFCSATSAKVLVCVVTMTGDGEDVHLGSVPKLRDDQDGNDSVEISRPSTAASTALAVPSQTETDVGMAEAPKMSLLGKRQTREHAADSEHYSESSAGVKKVKLAQDDAEQAGQAVTLNKLPRDKSQLSAEVWHHIFTFCPPRSLGNLLRVNKLFNFYLDPSSSLVNREVPLPAGKRPLDVLKPNVIWQLSRRLFWPQMPAPLRSMAEIDMWRLACSLTCQKCKKQPPTQSDSSSATPGPCLGPGLDGVAVIWPFARRLCGRCLVTTSMKVCLLQNREDPTTG